MIPSVAASERGTAQTIQVQAGRRCLGGVVGRCSSRLPPIRGVTNHHLSRRFQERAATEGDSPVGEKIGDSFTVFPSTMGHEESRGKLGGPSPKAKYYSATDSELVP